jgi:hypothetical protein
MTLNVSLVRSKLEYASSVLRPFYEVHINTIERVQIKLVGYALQRPGCKNIFFIYLFIYHQQSETPTDYILKNKFFSKNI